MIKRLSLKHRLFVAFLLFGLFVAATVGTQMFFHIRQVVHKNKENVLLTLRNDRIEKLQADYSYLLSRFKGFSYNVNVVQASEDLSDAFGRLGFSDEKNRDDCYNALKAYYSDKFADKLAIFDYPNADVTQYMPSSDSGLILQCYYILGMLVGENEQAAILNYAEKRNKHNNVFSNYAKEHDLKDILLICNDGNVVYSLAKNVDWGINLWREQAYRSTSVFKVYSATVASRDKNFLGVSDFYFYLPAMFAPLLSISTPLLDKNGNKVGVLLTTLDSTRIDKIVSNNYEWNSDILGNTGDIFLVGQDLLMRTNSRFISKDFYSYKSTLRESGYSGRELRILQALRTSVMTVKIHSKDTDSILSDLDGVETIVDYRDRPVISAFAPLRLSVDATAEQSLNVSTLDWGIIVNITEKEANEPINNLLVGVIYSTAFLIFGIGIMMFFVSNVVAREIQTELVYHESMLQSLVNNARDAIVVSDGNNRITSWNGAAEQMFGYSAYEIKSERIVPKLIPEKYEDALAGKVERKNYKHDDIVQERYEDILADRAAYSDDRFNPQRYEDMLVDKKNIENEYKFDTGISVEAEGLRKGGELFPIELSATRVQVYGKWNNLYIIRDVSARHQREEELRQAYEQARIAERGKMEFLANMSHEIRTPLNGIMGFLDLLNQTKLTPTQHDYMKIVNSSADSLLSIVNDILDFSKVENGRMELEKVDFNLIPVFEQTAELYTARANEKKVLLSLDLDPAIPSSMLGDSLRIRQVLTNLLSNAIKFTPSGGVVTLCAEVLSKNNDECKVRMAVEDTGIGIGSDTKSKIFTAFSQADTSVTRKYGGTGLGLAISSRLVHLMGSELCLESEVGVGSKFWFDATFNIGRHVINRPSFSNIKTAVMIDGESITHQEKTLIKYLTSLKAEVTAIQEIEELSYLRGTNIVFIDHKYTELLDQIPLSMDVVILQGEKWIDITHTSRPAYTISSPMNYSKLVNTLNTMIYGNRPDILEAKKSNNILFEGNVLVAEDNEVNQQLVNIMLTNLGVTVDIAEDGEAAYEKVISGHYDLIFMDIHMPRVDGVTATKKIIAWEKETNVGHTPIVALTANVIQEDQDLYIEAGMDNFLPKPIVPEMLKDVLGKYLPRSIQVNSEEISEVLRLGREMGIDDMLFLRSILQEFVSLSESQLKLAELAVNSGDFVDALMYGQSIYSAAASLSLTSIATAVEKFNRGCREANKISCMMVLEKLIYEIERVKSICENT